jgi:hypothetical protein
MLLLLRDLNAAFSGTLQRTGSSVHQAGIVGFSGSFAAVVVRLRLIIFLTLLRALRERGV